MASPYGPSTVEVDYLVRLKREQDEALATISNRIKHLQTTEQRVWKEITHTRQCCLNRRQAQIRHQGRTVERMQRVRAQQSLESELRNKVAESRLQQKTRLHAVSEGLLKRNQDAADDGREEGTHYLRIKRDDASRARLEAAARAEERRQKHAQAKLRRQVELAQREVEKRMLNKGRTQELEDQLMQINSTIREAESNELSIISRLQNSQALRDSLVNELETMQELSYQPGPLHSATGDDFPVVQGEQLSLATAPAAAQTPRSPRQLSEGTQLSPRGVAYSGVGSPPRGVSSHGDYPVPVALRRTGSGQVSATGSGFSPAKSDRSPAKPSMVRARSADPTVDSSAEADGNASLLELHEIQAKMAELQKQRSAYDQKLRQLCKPTAGLPPQTSPRQRPESMKFVPPSRSGHKARHPNTPGNASTVANSDASQLASPGSSEATGPSLSALDRQEAIYM